jgi:hypothetical protein
MSVEKNLMRQKCSGYGCLPVVALLVLLLRLRFLPREGRRFVTLPDSSPGTAGDGGGERHVAWWSWADRKERTKSSLHSSKRRLVSPTLHKHVDDDHDDDVDDVDDGQ